MLVAGVRRLGYVLAPVTGKRVALKLDELSTFLVQKPHPGRRNPGLQMELLFSRDSFLRLAKASGIRLQNRPACAAVYSGRGWKTADRATSITGGAAKSGRLWREVSEEGATEIILVEIRQTSPRN